MEFAVTTLIGTGFYVLLFAGWRGSRISIGRGDPTPIDPPSHVVHRNVDMQESVHFHADLENVSLFRVHTFPALIPRAASRILDATLDYVSSEQAQGRHGWNTAGHHAYYPTTDVAVASMPLVAREVDQIVEKSIFPRIRELFGEIVTDDRMLRLIDAFVVKYEGAGSRLRAETGPGEGRPQDHLPVHQDGGMFSANIALNAGRDYIGGGTLFPHLGCAMSEIGEDASDCPGSVVQLDVPGHAALHCGKLRHGGQVVDSGRRYILALFMELEDIPDNGSLNRANSIPGLARSNRAQQGTSLVEELLWREAIASFDNNNSSTVPVCTGKTAGRCASVNVAARRKAQATAFAELARLHLKRRTFHDDAAALAASQRGIELFADQVDSVLAGVHAKALARNGIEKEAVIFFQRSLQHDPSDASVCAEFANHLLDTGDLRGAKIQFQHARQLNSNDPKIHFELGNTLVALGDLPAAIASFEMVCLRRVCVCVARAFACARMLTWTFFVASISSSCALWFWSLGQAVVLDPQMATAFNNLGNAQRSLRQFEQAAESFARVAALQPGVSAAWLNFGTMVASAAKPDNAAAYAAALQEARRHFQKAFDLEIRAREKRRTECESKSDAGLGCAGPGVTQESNLEAAARKNLQRVEAALQVLENEAPNEAPHHSP